MTTSYIIIVFFKVRFLFVHFRLKDSHFSSMNIIVFHRLFLFDYDSVMIKKHFKIRS